MLTRRPGCLYNHDIGQANSAQIVSNANSRKGFNVDSPSFQPLLPVGNGASSGTKSASISPRAANAAIFTPKSLKASKYSVSHQLKLWPEQVLIIAQTLPLPEDTPPKARVTGAHKRSMSLFHKHTTATSWYVQPLVQRFQAELHNSARATKGHGIPYEAQIPYYTDIILLGLY